jgi:hypothetical protein
MTFTEAMTLRVGDRVTAAARPGETGTIVAIRRGVWTIVWQGSDNPISRREDRPMGVCSKLEKLS